MPWYVVAVVVIVGVGGMLAGCGDVDGDGTNTPGPTACAIPPTPTIPPTGTPGTPPPTPTTPPPTPGVYVVQAGDTLYGIASAYGISVDALAAANNIDVNGLLSIGQVLNIPTPTPPPPIPTTYSAELKEFVKHEEGQVLFLYNDSGGNCTVGIGCLIHTGACTKQDCENFTDDEGRIGCISEQEAEELFTERLIEANNQVYKALENSQTLTQYQYDALVSYTYQMGVGSLGDSLIPVHAAEGEYAEIAQFLLNQAGAGAIGERRNREYQIFTGTTPYPKKDLFIRGCGEGGGSWVDVCAPHRNG
jgi:LysM repeat protein